VNPQSSAQLTARNRFTTYSQGWRGLTESQRQQWLAAVSDFQRTNVFGQTMTPSGSNLYQLLNNNLVNIGEAAISVPPLPAAVGSFVPTSLTAEDSTVAASLSLVASGNVPANTAIKVFATSPQSAGRSFVKSQYRQISVLAAAATTPFDLVTAYEAKFGSTGTAGQKIFIKCVAVNATTGQEGTPSEVSAIVSVSA
jgi:hypothetical protein